MTTLIITRGYPSSGRGFLMERFIVRDFITSDEYPCSTVDEVIAAVDYLTVGCGLLVQCEQEERDEIISDARQASYAGVGVPVTFYYPYTEIEVESWRPN